MFRLVGICRDEVMRIGLGFFGSNKDEKEYMYEKIDLERIYIRVSFSGYL